MHANYKILGFEVNGHGVKALPGSSHFIGSPPPEKLQDLGTCQSYSTRQPHNGSFRPRFVNTVPCDELVGCEPLATSHGLCRTRAAPGPCQIDLSAACPAPSATSIYPWSGLRSGLWRPEPPKKDRNTVTWSSRGVPIKLFRGTSDGIPLDHYYGSLTLAGSRANRPHCSGRSLLPPVSPLLPIGRRRPGLNERSAVWRPVLEIDHVRDLPFRIAALDYRPQYI